MEVNSATQRAYFKRARDKWRNYLTGATLIDVKNPDVASRIANQDNIAGSCWNEMDKHGDRKYVWCYYPEVLLDRTTRLPGYTGFIMSTFNSLKNMALSCYMPGSEWYGNEQLKADIADALEWMLDNSYNTKMAIPHKYTGAFNWWHLEIGSAIPLAETILIMYDQLSHELRNKALKSLDYFNPDPMYGSIDGDGGTKLSGANLIWKIYSYAVAALVEESSEKLNKALDSLRDVPNKGLNSILGFVKSGDGFYEDGSLIQHGGFAYTGGYGVALIDYLSNLIYLFSGTAWDLTEEEYKFIYNMIFNSYEPVMYKGLVMDMVRGREISRDYASDHGQGSCIITSVLRFSQMFPGKEGENLAALAKSWILQDTYRCYLANQQNIYMYLLAEKIIKDESIQPMKDLYYYKQFAGMDRAVMKKPGFAFGISMNSSRGSNYESINGDNIKGWYTGDGMTYLYNSDLGQFQNFWPTVDIYSLPGTTVDTQLRQAFSKSFGTSYISSRSWVGGSSLYGQYGTSGMWLDAELSTLEAKKSWFLFDDIIVALGAGINSTDNRNIKTIVENRKISRKTDYEDPTDEVMLTVNGVKQTAGLGSTVRTCDVVWAHLEGSIPGADIGYYFPDTADLFTIREQRTGNWNEIGTSYGVVSENYQVMWLDHGVNPANAVYSYALLPDKTASETEAYSKNPSVEILANTASVQAVRQKKLNITGINFWEPGTLNYLRAFHPSSVMLIDDGKGCLDISVSDPTQLQQEVILKIGYKGLAVFSSDPTVTVFETSPDIIIKVDTGNADGKSHVLSLSYEV